MASHSILSLRYVVNHLQEQGCDTAPTLARYGLNLDRIAPDTRIDCALELRVFCELCELTRDPTVGLSVGRRIGLAGYGPFSLMLLTCTTPWEAMQASVRYQALTYLFSRLELKPGKQHSELTLKPLEMPEWPRRVRIDLEFSGCLKLMQDVSLALNSKLQLEQVSLPYPRPPESKAYEAFFGCPVSFNASHARIQINNSGLQQPMSGADAMANALYRQECDRLLAVALRENSQEISEQVRQHLMLFQRGYPDAPAVASALGMSERSLRKHLRAQGTSFRRLLEQVRYARASEQLLHTGDSIESIALLLGYAETASFIHAFQRWTGCSPSHFRRMAGKP